MWMRTALLNASLACILAACDSASPPSDSVPARPVAAAETADVNKAATDALAAADAALANAGAAIDQTVGADVDADPIEPPARSGAPSYDTIEYCRTIGDTAGGSAMSEQTCREQEAGALAAIRSRSISPRMHDYCDSIGETAGGSYVIYNTCVDMESEAASQL